MSALMCPEHRTQVISHIREYLKAGKPCRVISTQLIEAGVDIDFPVVFRATAGIDSIAQAAGRCNREGKLDQGGHVYIFTPESGLPPGHFRQTADIGTMVLRKHGDPLSLAAVKEYFQHLYWRKGEKLDEFQILADISEGKKNGNFPFRQVSEKFQIIKHGYESVIIPWNTEAEKLIEALQSSNTPALLARKVQRFTINIPPKLIESLLNEGILRNIAGQFNILVRKDLYSDDIGFCPSELKKSEDFVS